MRFTDEQMDEMQEQEDKAQAVDALRWQAEAVDETSSDYGKKLEAAMAEGKNKHSGKFEFLYNTGFFDGLAFGQKIEQERLRKIGGDK